jgi:hypothetical protein
MEESTKNNMSNTAPTWISMFSVKLSLHNTGTQNIPHDAYLAQRNQGTLMHNLETFRQ